MSQEDAKFLRQEYTKLQQELDEAREKIEADLRMNELMRQYHAAQARGLQNAYPYSQSPYGTQSLTTATPKPKTLWERFKEVASRPLGHGDYY